MRAVLFLTTVLLSCWAWGQSCPVNSVLPDKGKVNETLQFSVNLISADWQFTGPDGLKEFEGTAINVVFRQPGTYQGVVAGPNACEEVVRLEFTVNIYAPLGAASLQINGGSEFTNQTQVQLSLQAPGALEMLISTNPNCRDGAWESFQPQKAYVLYFTNQTGRVFAKFRNPVEETACVSDEITHDDVAPVVQRLQAPKALSNEEAARFRFAITDNPSGLDAFLCSTTGQPNQPCDLDFEIKSQPGENTLVYRAVDRAGNRSPVHMYIWTVDLEPPVVSIVQSPDSVTNLGSAQFLFSAQDNFSTNITFLCQLDQAVAPCSNPVQFQGLSDGPHRLSVIAEDEVGNRSLPAVYQWLVDTLPPQLAWVKTPPAVVGQSDVNLEFSVTDGGSGISSVWCQLNQDPEYVCGELVELSDLPNGPYRFQVRADDLAGNPSAVLVTEWEVIVDGPTVAITDTPPLETPMTEAQFQFIAQAPAGLDRVECSLNNSGFSDCVSPVVFQNLSLGAQVFSVRAFDVLGRVSETETFEWTVVRLPNLVQEEFLSPGSSRAVDFLFVVDNSWSMVYEQKKENIRRNFAGILDLFAGVDYQIAVTTTDVKGRKPGEEGRLLPFSNGSSVLLPGAPAAEGNLLNVIHQGYNGSTKEQPILATLMAIDRPENEPFFRPGVPLMALFFTDEDEGSTGKSKKVIHRPMLLLDRVKKKWGGKKSLMVHTVQWRPTDDHCEYGFNKGVVIDRLVRKTGGVSASICEEPYVPQLAGMLDSIGDDAFTWTLKCLPLGQNINVRYEPAPAVLPNLSLQDDRLSFVPAPPPGTQVFLNYECAKTLMDLQ